MMPRRLIIHPGWSKTGTTAIQNYFAEHYDQYLASGILYPRSGRLIDNAHHNLALALNPRPNLEASDSAQAIIAALLREHISSGAHHLILSSELFPFLPDYPEIELLCNHFDSVELIFTLRRQSDLIVSLYKHLLRDPSMVFFETFGELLAAHADWMNFEREVLRWTQWPVVAETRVMCSGQSLVRDFTSHLQIPAFADALPLTNTSPTDIVALVLAATAIARDTMSVQRREEFVTYLMRELEPLARRFSVIDETQANLIDGFYSGGNRALAAKYPDARKLCEKRATQAATVPSEQTVTALADVLLQAFRRG